MYRIKAVGTWYLCLVILVLLSVGLWSGCRSDPSTEPAGDLGQVVTSRTSADIRIVERGAPRLTQVQPVPGNIVLAPGETIGLSAIAFDQSGRELDSVSVSWQVLDSQVGTITPAGVFRAGFVKGAFDDVLLVTARAPAAMGPGMVQATASVTVSEFRRDLRPTGIRVIPETAEVKPDELLSLMAFTVDANDVAIPDMKFKWEMSEPLAGSISQDGRLTASANPGIFPGAVRITLLTKEDYVGPLISTNLDVRVVDPASLEERISATVLPQVISLRPKENIRFAAIVLDNRGRQVSSIAPRWEVVDAAAGVISQDGQFVANKKSGIYTDAVQASVEVPGVDEPITATGTVIIVEATPLPGPEAGRLGRVAIFPERVVLSPGESARVSVIGVDGDVAGMTDASVRWSVNPPEVGEVSQFVTITAHDYPGVYEKAIRAEVLLETENGPVTREINATLVIRGTLASAEIIPGAASLARGEQILFRAVAYDKNRILLPNVIFRWSVADPAAGSIDVNGAFTAEGSIGDYPGAVQIEVVQQVRSSSP